MIVITAMAIKRFDGPRMRIFANGFDISSAPTQFFGCKDDLVVNRVQQIDIHGETIRLADGTEVVFGVHPEVAEIFKVFADLPYYYRRAQEDNVKLRSDVSRLERVERKYDALKRKPWYRRMLDAMTGNL